MKTVRKMLKDLSHHFLVLPPAVKQNHIIAAAFFQVCGFYSKYFSIFRHIAIIIAQIGPDPNRKSLCAVSVSA